MKVIHYPLEKAPQNTTETQKLYVADEIFGNCLKLSTSDSLTLESGISTPNAFSLSLWIKPDAVPEANQTLLQAMNENGTPVLSIENTASGELIFRSGKDESNHDTLTYQLDATQRTGDWQNWAFSKNSETGTMAIWLNGKNVTSQADKSKAPGNLHRIQLGTSFQGRLSNLRIYDRQLDAKQLETTLNADLSTLTAFHKENPIDFWLHDHDLLDILPISNDPAGTFLYLDIINTSAKSMELTETTSFELRFRPGTLSESCKKRLREQKQEKWSLQLIEHTDHTESIRLTPQNTITLNPGKEQALRIPLSGMAAATAGGARGTRVELHYSGVAFSGTTTETLSGKRTAQLDIVKTTGVPINPFSISFTGGNLVINDGEAKNSLWLRIANALESETIQLTKSSRFFLSFDEGDPSVNWALGNKDQVQSITISTRKKDSEGNWVLASEWNVSKSEQGNCSTWEISPKEEMRLSFAEGLTIQLDNIITTHPAGFCNLHVRYHNIPGIQDGYETCLIEKIPRMLHAGMIMMWSGNENSIPSGWVLCDGTNNAPDLRDRFIVGASAANSAHTKGDPTTHTHAISGGDHSHYTTDKKWYGITVTGGPEGYNTFGICSDGQTREQVQEQQTSNENHAHIIKDHDGEIRPKWFALCFIMYVGNAR